MKSNEKHIAQLGHGIYTMSDMAKILKLPYGKVNYWLNVYWDGLLKGKRSSYSWKSNDVRVVNFHTLIEFYTMMHFGERGIKPKMVLKAHESLSDIYKTKFPFANGKILSELNTDGEKIYIERNDEQLSLDGTWQFSMKFIEEFFIKLEFNENDLVSRFWPLGKNKRIVVDPSRQFGQPIISNTNIHPNVIYKLYQGGEPIEFISSLYDLDEDVVKHAIEFIESKAA